MLEDRLLRAIELYKNNISPKIIMSGDHGKEDYDEVNTMKDFAIEKGVPSDQRQYIGAGYIKNTVDFKLMEIKLKKWNEENK